MGNTQRAKLRPEALLDLVESTNFTEDEIRIWYRDFCKQYPNGRVSIEQFREAYSQNFPNGDAVKFTEHVLHNLDVKEGLDFRQFICALDITLQSRPEDRLRWAFNMFDVDESGYIGKKECIQIIKAIYLLRGGDLPTDVHRMTEEERTNKIFDTMDIDNDGLITENQLIDGVRSDEYLIRILQHDQMRY